MTPTLFRADHEPSLWLRRRISSVLTAHRSLMFGQCGHLDPSDQYAAHVPLWDAEIRACQHCLPSYQAEGEENLRCDRCGAIHGDTAPFAAFAASHTIVHGGLCPACGEREVR